MMRDFMPNELRWVGPETTTLITDAPMFTHVNVPVAFARGGITKGGGPSTVWAHSNHSVGENILEEWSRNNPVIFHAYNQYDTDRPADSTDPLLTTVDRLVLRTFLKSHTHSFAPESMPDWLLWAHRERLCELLAKFSSKGTEKRIRNKLCSIPAASFTPQTPQASPKPRTEGDRMRDFFFGKSRSGLSDLPSWKRRGRG
jgi:hypothetical protein